MKSAGNWSFDLWLEESYWTKTLIRIKNLSTASLKYVPQSLLLATAIFNSLLFQTFYEYLWFITCLQWSQVISYGYVILQKLFHTVAEGKHTTLHHFTNTSLTFFLSQAHTLQTHLLHDSFQPEHINHRCRHRCISNQEKSVISDSVEKQTDRPIFNNSAGVCGATGTHWTGINPQFRGLSTKWGCSPGSTWA